MEELTDCLKKNKPNISPNSVKTYVSILRSFYYQHHSKGTEMNCKWFDNEDDIVKLLKDKPASSRKTTYSALIALTNNSKYKKLLMEDGKEYQEFINEQKKTETQEENWKDFDEVKSLYDDMYKRVKPILKFEKINNNDFKLLTDFIIFSLTSGVWFPPRRSLDWIEMKIKNVDTKEDNYIDESKNEFVFNRYKTAKYYGEQKVEIPKKFKSILKKFMKLNPHEYLLTDNNGKQLTNVKLSQRLNKIFDNKISTSMLRHIYLTDKLKDVPALTELNKMASDMGHSVPEALQYVKK
jgi:hypothetical protein